MRPVATSNRVEIRTARPDERPALEALMRRASLALPNYRAQLEAHSEVFSLPAEQFARDDVLVAEIDGEVAGFAAIDGNELDGLFVEPDKWRMGVGTALVAAVVHEARRRGLRLTVIAGPDAVPFYQRCGFSVEGEEATRFGPAFRLSR